MLSKYSAINKKCISSIRNNIYTLVVITTIVLFINSPYASAQQLEKSKAIVTAGSSYDAGWFHKLFAGYLWRDLWIAPFEVEYLNLNNFAGGLKPVKTGGGLQTKSLHFIGNDGRKYKFRSVDKDPSRSLPLEFRETIIADAMQDQVPVQNPVSSVIVAHLMNEIEVLNAEPVLYIMPDSELLSEFRNEFAGMLGTIEENPDDYDEESLNFGNSDKIVSTFKLLEKLEEDNDESVDELEFLKARLFDVFIGDRDRHSGQWNWAAYEDGNKRNWKPIPKDRDFAFPLYDGLVPLLMRAAIISIVHFDYDMPSMFDITWEGRHLDRRFLTGIDKADWDSVSNYMIAKLSDDVIESAVKKMPQELFDLRGVELIDKLKSRRNQLKDASDEYYELIMKYADIHCSDKKEFVEVIRSSDTTTIVRMYKRKKNIQNEKGELLFEKSYNHKYTNEIRIYLKGGDDKAVISGNVEYGIRIIIDGGNGADEFIDSSTTMNKVLGFLPIRKNKTEFYDSGKKSVFVKGPATYVNTSEFPQSDDPDDYYEPKTENRSSDFGLLFPFALNSDDGLVYGIGGGFNFYDYRMEPYSHRLEFTASNSTKSQSLEFILNGDFNQILNDINFNFQLKSTGHQINRFYGIGNETEYDEQLEKDEYYYVSQKNHSGIVMMNFPITDKLSFSTGFSLQEVNVRRRIGSLVDLGSFKGKGKNSFLSVISQITYDSRDHIEAPEKGMMLKIAAEQDPGLLSYSTAFGNVSTEAMFYLNGFSFTQNVLALRFIGEYAWGNYPFYKSANVGGSDKLRGFDPKRFSGDAAIAVQAEYRFLLGTVTVFIPGKLGVNIFSDTGRVFKKNERSLKWHNSFGGGLWFNILNRFFTFSMNVAKSKEDIKFYLSTGYSF